MSCQLAGFVFSDNFDDRWAAKRRSDIQGLRGVAIIYVLIFHLWPEVFPYGYLGVDIFFVISGYLITFILWNQKPFTVKVFLSFYKKRIKRIFPAYYLMLFFVLKFGCFTLTAIDYSTLRGEALWASSFATNILKYYQDLNYFAEVFLITYKSKFRKKQFLNDINRVELRLLVKADKCLKITIFLRICWNIFSRYQAMISFFIPGR